MQNISDFRFFILLLLLSVSSCLLGQYDIASFRTIQDEYPEENIIKLSKKIKFIIDINENTPDISMINNERILYLKNAKNVDPEQSVYTSTFNELVEFEANSYILENNRYKRIPVKTFDVIKKYDEGVFYDDYQELVFTYPGIAEGSIIELNTVHKINEPRLLGTVFLNEYYPVHEFEMIIECDENAEIDLIKKNFPDHGVEIHEIRKNKKKIYSLNLDKRESIRYNEYQPDRRYFVPHIIPIFRSYSTDDQKIQLLGNCNDLYEWYYSFVAGLDEDVDHVALQGIVKQIIDENAPEKEKVGLLYQWVQENIKYIAFEDGMGGFIPRKPDEILLKRYGDCKDKASLLHALLKEAGVSTYFTWIGTRDLPYGYAEFCSPVVDNHMILTYVNDGNYYYLDATGGYQSIDIPTSLIQGKEALIGLDSLRFEIRKVPVVAREQNEVIDSVRLEMNRGSLTGEGRLILSGLPKISFQHLTSMDDTEEQKRVVEEIVRKGSNKFVLTNFEMLTNQKFEEKADLTYEFTIDSYAQSAGDEIYLNLNLDRNVLDFKLKKDRRTPFVLNNTLSQMQTFVFKIPEGYRVDYLPPNSSYHTDDFGYELDYRNNENEIMYTQKIYLNKIYFNQDELSEWNHFIESLEKIYKETILIKEINED